MEVRKQTVAQQRVRVDQGLRAYMVRVYGVMALGLALSGVIAFATASSPAVLNAIFGTGLRWFVMFAPLFMVMALAGMLHRMSSAVATACFVGYASLMGVSLSTIFLVYTHGSIASTFGVSAAVFASMGVYGYTTKRDLTSMGSFLIMGVWGLIIASLVNLFLKNSMMDWMLSVVTVGIFTGLTAYDTQKIRMIYNAADSTNVLGKKVVMGALCLYLDFVNIFLSLLRLFGDRK